MRNTARLSVEVHLIYSIPVFFYSDLFISNPDWRQKWGTDG